ncbi:unnamed protein product, partial [marine sediment metagenome]
MIMPWKRAATVLVLLAWTAVAPAATQQERILGYHSDITVHPDGWLTVTETIRVHAAGNRIKRGIYRDFPVRYVGRDGGKVRVPFEVVRVERDGRPEPWHTTPKDPFQRVYMGGEGSALTP